MFAVYKSLSTILSTLFFYKLTTHDFSLWATTNSSIYLLILWLDLGLSKSVPRYTPVFARSATEHKQFIIWVCVIQLMLLLIGIPFLVYYISKTSSSLLLLIIALATFIAEGAVKIFRLMYHAQFHNKQFNLYSTAAILLETAIDVVLLATIKDSAQLLIGILLAKLCCSVLLALYSLYNVPSLYKDKEYPGDQQLNIMKAIKDCVLHSLAMGSTTILTSLSERNFLIPLFTAALGREAGNIFKVANDWALLFYRTAIKTIGYNDTALLSHIETMPNRKALFPEAFATLSNKIATLCVPILALLGLLLFYSIRTNHTSVAFELFFIIAISYMTEALFSMYERVLEVKRRYMFLAVSYIPYIAILIGMFFVSSFGLVSSVLWVQGIRLVQVLFFIGFVRFGYGLRFPARFVIRLALYMLPVCIALYLIAPFALPPILHAQHHIKAVIMRLLGYTE